MTQHLQRTIATETQRMIRVQSPQSQSYNHAERLVQVYCVLCSYLR